MIILFHKPLPSLPEGRNRTRALALLMAVMLSSVEAWWADLCALPFNGAQGDSPAFMFPQGHSEIEVSPQINQLEISTGGTYGAKERALFEL